MLKTTYWVMYHHRIPPYREGQAWTEGDVQHFGTPDVEVARKAVRDFNEKYISKGTHFATWAGRHGVITEVWIEREDRIIFEREK